MSEERPTKQVIVMRKDLNMRKGKMVAQGSHACLKALLDTGVIGHLNGDYEELPKPMRLWLEGSFTKICVSVNSEEELTAIYDKAAADLPDAPKVLIIDAGRTEFNGVPTKTCCAIGPWWADEIDAITGALPLL